MHLGLGLRVEISEVLPTTDCQKMLEPLIITRIKNEKCFSNEKLNPSNKNYDSVIQARKIMIPHHHCHSQPDFPG